MISKELKGGFYTRTLYLVALTVQECLPSGREKCSQLKSEYRKRTHTHTHVHMHTLKWMSSKPCTFIQTNARRKMAPFSAPPFPVFLHEANRTKQTHVNDSHLTHSSVYYVFFFLPAVCVYTPI